MRNLKKALSLALASVMVLGMMVVGSSAKASPDVKPEHNVKAIELVKVLGIMNGDNAGNWNPEQALTRNELAVVIAKLANLPLNGNHPFTDVPGWANKYVGALYANGITTGTSATTFGGAQQVTTVEAALMMERVVGYMNLPGELKFHGGFTMGTSKVGQKIGLFEDVNSMLTGPVTRNNVAQMVKNLLNAELVIANKVGGAEVTSPDMSVTVPATFTYDYVKSGYVDGNGAPIAKTLMEKVYGVYSTEDLAKKDVTDDGFGRPAVQYVYKGHTSDVVVSKNPTLTFNTELNDKDLLKALGMKAADVDSGKVHVRVDGAVDKAVAVNDDAAKDAIDGTKAGLKTEVFVKTIAENGSTNYEVTLVVTTSYVAKVEKVINAKGENKRAIKIDGETKTFETDKFAKDDVVVYTKDQRAGKTNEILTVELANKQVGKLTTANITKNLYTINGTEYTAAVSGSFGVAGNVTKDVEYYVVNGHILGMKPVDGVVADDYALVLTSGEQEDIYGGGTTYFAKFLLADGSVVKAQYKYVTSVNAQTGVKTYGDLGDKNVVKYTVDNGVYMIAKDDAKKVTEGTDITANKANIANNETIFVVAVDAENDKYVVYTGVQNLPKYEAGSKYIVAGDSAKNANVIFVTAGSEAAKTSKDMIYVLAGAETFKGTGADGKEYTYYVYQAVVNGELTTIKLDNAQQDTGLYKAGTKNANGVYTLGEMATTENGVNVDKENKVLETADKGVIKLAKGGKMMYADNVQVYYVGTDGKLVDGSISDLTGETPIKGYLFNEQNVITTIYAGTLAAEQNA